MEKLQNGLVVSCQALVDEPLHSSFIMSKMALAPVQGGAVGIRANTVKDIQEIKKEVDVPLIGIIKKDYESTDVYITPSMTEVDALVKEGVDVIALDATFSKRKDNLTIDQLFKDIKSKYPDQVLMADCSTEEEMLHAAELGFDFISTTLVGYTKQSANINIADNDFEFVKNIISKTDVPVIVEGKIDTPLKFKRLLELGVFCVVVGSIITRPQIITRRFTEAIIK